MLAHLRAQAPNVAHGGQSAPAMVPFCLDCGVFAEENDQDYDLDGAIFFSMCRAYEGLPGINLPGSDQYMAGAVPLPGALQFSNGYANIGAAVVAGANAVNFDAVNIPDNEQRAYALMCSANVARGYGWLIDLIACYQVKAMKTKHIRSYFMAQDETKVDGSDIHHFILSVKATLPDIANDAVLLASLSQNDFMAYHLGYASTGAICQEMINFLGGLAIQVFSGPSIAAVTASANAPHSRALNALIPNAVRLHGFAYGKALKKDFGDWVQGEKARSRLPASMYNSIFAMYAQISALSDNSAIITAAPTTVAVIAAMPANCIGV